MMHLISISTHQTTETNITTYFNPQVTNFKRKTRLNILKTNVPFILNPFFLFHEVGICNHVFFMKPHKQLKDIGPYNRNYLAGSVYHDNAGWALRERDSRPASYERGRSYRIWPHSSIWPCTTRAYRKTLPRSILLCCNEILSELVRLEAGQLLMGSEPAVIPKSRFRNIFYCGIRKTIRNRGQRQRVNKSKLSEAKKNPTDGQ